MLVSCPPRKGDGLSTRAVSRDALQRGEVAAPRDMDVGAVYYVKPDATELTEQVFGMLPANRASRLNPTEALRYE